MKFGQGKELFSSVPSLINFFKIAVSKRKEPAPTPSQIPSNSSNSENRNHGNSSRNSQNNSSQNNSSQNNGIAPVPVKRVSRFAPIEPSSSLPPAPYNNTHANTAANTISNKKSFDSFLQKIKDRNVSYPDEQGGHNVDMEIDDTGGYNPPVPPQGMIPPPPSGPSLYQSSNQYYQ